MKPNPLFSLLCALLFGAVLGAACRSSGAHASARGEDSFRTLLYGYQSGLKPGGVRVVRDEAHWRELWSEHTAPMMPRPPVPSVDWGTDMVLCIALGARPTGGYGIEIESIERQGDRLVVDAIEKKPAPDAIEPQVVTHPYVFVTTPRSADRVELRLK